MNISVEKRTGDDKPLKLRSKIEEFGNSFTIIIPTKKRFIAVTLLPVWTGLWVIGIILVFTNFFNPRRSGPILPFHLFWLIGAIIAFTLGTLTFLWNIFGKEIAVFDTMKLSLIRKIGSFKIQKNYSLEHCKNFRVNSVKIKGSSTQGQMESLGFGPGRIAFDYGMKTVKFGSNIDEEEAGYIIDLIQKRGFIKKQ